MKPVTSGKMKKVLAAVLLIALIAGGVVVMLPTIEGMKFKNDELESCSVSTGGGMLGGNSGAYLSRDNDGNAVLEIRKRETHADREITTTYKVDNAAFDHIRGIVVKCDLYAASKKGYSEFQALDADTTTLHFSFSEGSVRISDEQELRFCGTKKEYLTRAAPPPFYTQDAMLRETRSPTVPRPSTVTSKTPTEPLRARVASPPSSDVFGTR